MIIVISLRVHAFIDGLTKYWKSCSFFFLRKMATLKETFSAQLHDLQADIDKYMEQSKTLGAENEELKEKGEMLSHDVREL